jgi:hypothetical protein
MAKGECKAIEALLDVLKSIFNVWSVFTLAWAGAVGTLLKNPPQKEWLLTASVVGLTFFALTWGVIVILMVRFALKLKNCEEV